MDLEARLSSRVKRIKISATKEMPMIAAQVGGCVSLGQGIPSFMTPPHVVDAVAKALREDPAAGKYSLQPGMPALRAAAAELLRAEKNLPADPEREVAITVGGMEGLLCAMLTLVGPGDEVIVPEPFYPSHVEQIMLAEGTPVFAPLRRIDWGLDVDAVAAAITPRTKAIIVSSPHNPTGAVFAKADLLKLAELALRHEIFVICDDTYDALTYDGPDPEGAFSLMSVPELRHLLIGVFSFSKRFALTGWRVGFLWAREELLNQMLKIHDAAAICAPTPAQIAALASLAGPQDVFRAMRDELHKRRDLICARLDAMGGRFSHIRPRGAFYVLAKAEFPIVDSRDLALRVIREARVITIPGGAFGPGAEGHLRLSFGGAEAEIDTACDRLAAWAEKL
ncbi:MAG: pyridoxal phosphate-dependent aminotransferase [Humidesulfovibrio sp.]|uniref:pyridoxal phosphate-dependent aminotransferase n=1 Tax=Humidesulfovibrio sp. TaxID=2910988 RepID=UPI0027EF8AC3|nr:pyridoxal phosphate-dependent aminotransferase [Humidesulfovibrio sp.]MDQ7836204.1 pyridoxal phosphate-dependent aminotransferase [Humidesulfovibrio sp.]